MQWIKTGTVGVNMLKKSKCFHCLPSGKPDKNAIAEIQTFIDSVSLHTWLGSGYVHTGSIHTGIPAIRVLHNMLFDKRIKIRHSKSVNIKRDDDILLVSTKGRTDNKQFHRTDDSLEAIDTEDVKNCSNYVCVMFISHISV